MLVVVDVRLPLDLSVATSLAFGCAFFAAPDLLARRAASNRRQDFRQALTSYLDLVALMRSAGAGATEALEAPAEIGAGWEFSQLKEAIDHAHRAGEPPWLGLAMLASRYGISELADIANIAALADQEGARILDTLMARAESMRTKQLAEVHAISIARTTTMSIPIAVMAGGFLVLLTYPMISALFAA
jgi:Flp pilus assembly protein TadB